MTDRLVLNCSNCGTVTETDENLQEVGYQGYENGICRTGCPVCKSFTIQRRWDYSPRGGGEFLIVKTRNKIRR